MKTKVKIQKNDYCVPTEIRQDVVQQILDIFMEKLKSSWNWGFDVQIDAGLYILVYGSFGRSIGNYCNYATLRIRGCEMKEAFKIFQESGYYIFAIHDSESFYKYTISKKPSWNDRKAENVVFDVQID